MWFILTKEVLGKLSAASWSVNLSYHFIILNHSNSSFSPHFFYLFFFYQILSFTFLLLLFIFCKEFLPSEAHSDLLPWRPLLEFINESSSAFPVNPVSYSDFLKSPEPGVIQEHQHYYCMCSIYIWEVLSWGTLEMAKCRERRPLLLLTAHIIKSCWKSSWSSGI